MRTTTANDLRVTKTLEAIDTTFRAMMLEHGYESITVKDSASGRASTRRPSIGTTKPLMTCWSR